MSVPYWRYVDYTDDGCVHYQCLQCGGGWEARTEPGWFDNFEYVDNPFGQHKEVHHHQRTVNGKKEDVFYIERDKPVYRPAWKFCPYCGCEWKGPIQCGYDNSRMFGPKRARIQRMVDKYHSDAIWAKPRRNRDPRWYWVLMKRDTWPNRDAAEWQVDAKFDPRLTSAYGIHKELQDVREQCWQDDNNCLFGVKHEAKIIKCNANDPKIRHAYLRSSYPREAPLMQVTVVE